MSTTQATAKARCTNTTGFRLVKAWGPCTEQSACVVDACSYGSGMADYEHGLRLHVAYAYTWGAR